MLGWPRKHRRETTVPLQKKSRRRKIILITLGAVVAAGILNLWLPYRVAMLQLFFWLGGSRVLVALEYKPLDSPLYVPIDEADQYPLDMEVLGMEIGGIAKAIPVNRIAWHLVVNDEIGGEPVVVTLCTVSDAAMAFRAECGPRTLHFAPARLAHNNMIFRDQQTGSAWQQFSGQALDGPLAGARLERLPLERCRLDEWRQRHPRSKIIQPLGDYRDRSAPNDTCPVMSFFSTESFLLQPPDHEDGRLPRKQQIVGTLQSDGPWIACPFVERTGKPGQTGVNLRCYWFAWIEFCPQTLLVESFDDLKPISFGSENQSDGREQ
jgi:hypothetical protein